MTSLVGRPGRGLLRWRAHAWVNVDPDHDNAVNFDSAGWSTIHIDIRHRASTADFDIECRLRDLLIDLGFQYQMSKFDVRHRFSMFDIDLRCSTSIFNFRFRYWMSKIDIRHRSSILSTYALHTQQVSKKTIPSKICYKVSTTTNSSPGKSRQ